MTVEAALRQGTRLLDDASVSVPRLTAEVLLSFALDRDRTFLFTHPEHELGEIAWLHYGRYLHQRMQGKPTQYITKRQEFYGREFRVTKDVLIPRPETEHLVETAVPLLTAESTVIDVGAGSGAIAVTLQLEAKCHVLASDYSEAAVGVARENARRLGAHAGFFCGDLLEAIRDDSLDMVASNPPYVAATDEPVLQREVRDWEPHMALFGGETGLEVYRRLIPEAERVLKPGGWLVMELGYRSLEPVMRMLGRAWSGGEAISDLAGVPRVLKARLR